MLTSTHLRHTMSILRSRAFFSTGPSLVGSAISATVPSASTLVSATKPTAPTTSTLSSLYPAGAKVPASFPAFPPKAPLKPRKQPSKMQRPLGPLPPLLATHPQTGNRSMSGSVPGYGKTLTTEELVALRRRLGMGEEAAGAGTPSATPPTSPRERLPTLRSLRMRRLVFPPATVADPQGRVFAVVSVKGKQFKVSPGDVINAEKYKGVKVGEVLSLPPMVVGSRERTLVGRPTVQGAMVRLVVQEHVQDLKVIVYKKKRRKRYQKKNGFRRTVTRLLVEAVDVDFEGY